MKMDNLAEGLSIRQLQIYAALCLRCYCCKLGIAHDAIDELFHHLISIATTENLGDWEQQGLKIDLVGRGDPIPKHIADAISSEHLASFSELVENSIEVGFVDMYGAPTDQPRQFAERCVSILKGAKVAAPPVSEIVKYGHGVDGWGEAITRTELDEILLVYGV